MASGSVPYDVTGVETPLAGALLRLPDLGAGLPASDGMSVPVPNFPRSRIEATATTARSVRVHDLGYPPNALSVPVQNSPELPGEGGPRGRCLSRTSRRRRTEMSVPVQNLPELHAFGDRGDGDDRAVGACPRPEVPPYVLSVPVPDSGPDPDREAASPSPLGVPRPRAGTTSERTGCPRPTPLAADVRPFQPTSVPPTPSRPRASRRQPLPTTPPAIRRL